MMRRITRTINQGNSGVCIVLPREIQKKIGWEVGTIIMVEVVDDTLVLTKEKE